MRRTFKRRRLENKTDYQARLVMLKSDKARLVVRKTNKYVIAQIVSSKGAQDKVLINLSSKDLLDHGWPKEKAGSLKSLAAAYLLGVMIGKKAKSHSLGFILDIGMQRSIPKSRLFAVLKGAVDAGLDIPHDASVLPSIELIKSNKSTSALVDKLKEKM